MPATWKIPTTLFCKIWGTETLAPHKVLNTTSIKQSSNSSSLAVQQIFKKEKKSALSSREFEVMEKFKFSV